MKAEKKAAAECAEARARAESIGGELGKRVLGLEAEAAQMRGELETRADATEARETPRGGTISSAAAAAAGTPPLGLISRGVPILALFLLYPLGSAPPLPVAYRDDFAAYYTSSPKAPVYLSVPKYTDGLVYFFCHQSDQVYPIFAKT